MPAWHLSGRATGEDAVGPTAGMGPGDGPHSRSPQPAPSCSTGDGEERPHVPYPGVIRDK